MFKLPRHLYWLLLIVIVNLFLLTILIHFLWYAPTQKNDNIVEIPLHSGTIKITQLLQKAKVIRSAKFFQVYLALTGKARKLKAGEYSFPARASMTSVANKLVAGEVIIHAITIPEGFTLKQIAQKLSEQKLVKQDDFLLLATKSTLAKNWNIPSQKLEGFLFPDTYHWIKGISTRKIIEQMLDSFWQHVDKSLIIAAKKQNFNLYKLITLASIIEKEAKAKKELPLIASVFYNRLKKNMRLESCATVLYSQNRTTGPVTLKDLETVSPYNTYQHKGLPPGPICNPGLAAIQAAAFPAKTDYLFFVVKSDGTHVFSRDFTEHKRAKWQQKKIKHQKIRL